MSAQIPEVRVVYFGTPNLSALVLEKLLSTWKGESNSNSRLHLKGVSINKPLKITIQTVVTSPDKPIGRSKTLTASPVAQVAQKYGLTTLKPEKLDGEFLKNHLSLLSSDLFIVVAYGKILPKELLEIPNFGALNVHPSLLPKYRGPSPIQAAILNGDKVSGVTTIKMDEKMDHGPIVSAMEISLSDKDTFESLSKKMFTLGADLLIQKIMEIIEGKATQVIQNHAEATYTKLITKEDGYFDLPACLPTGKAGRQVSIKFLEKLDRMIRAYYPWPTAWTKWSFDKIQDKIVKFLPEGMVQMEGKKAVRLEEFLRGYPTFPVKKLEP